MSVGGSIGATLLLVFWPLAFSRVRIISSSTAHTITPPPTPTATPTTNAVLEVVATARAEGVGMR